MVIYVTMTDRGSVTLSATKLKPSPCSYHFSVDVAHVGSNKAIMLKDRGIYCQHIRTSIMVLNIQFYNLFFFFESKDKLTQAVCSYISRAYFGWFHSVNTGD